MGFSETDFFVIYTLEQSVSFFFRSLDLHYCSN